MTTSSRSSNSNPAYAGFYPVIAPLIMCSGVGDGKTTACDRRDTALKYGDGVIEDEDQSPAERSVQRAARSHAWHEMEPRVHRDPPGGCSAFYGPIRHPLTCKENTKTKVGSDSKRQTT